MKNKILLIFLLSLITQSFLYSQWIQQSVPVDKPISGIEFVNANTGWAVTERFTNMDTSYILYTSNGGTNWNIQYFGNFRLYCLNVINENIVYAGGTGGGTAKLFKSSNGGVNWINMNIGVSTGIDDMFFVNADSRYICDALAPSVYTTTDGGISWIQRPHPVQSPKVLFFLNYDTGYCGGGGEIFKTINAGLNWNYLNNLGVGGRQILSIQFLNNDKGWVGLTNNRIGLTTNGGFNWTLIMPNTIGSYEIHGLYFLTDSIGWCGPDISASIYKTLNGGLNWTTQNTNIWGSRTIQFLDSLTGWSAFFPISKTTNGGVTFIRGLNTEIANTFKLYQNYPNPFNPNTKIRFTITKNSDVTISVYNILGKEVFNWRSDGNLNKGIYEYEFIPDNLSSGVYIYKLTAKSDGNVFSDSKKMIYLK
ncbi:MAG: T9SS type A sorting domain-containing protein [Ignavibacteria bacterium]|nr:T9SS type A sorting domain-containing protein [Ignavibacteria bacterium]